MFRSLPTLLIICFSVVLGYGVSLSTSSLAGSFEIPRYGGVIEPITTPVVIQYRPFPKVPFTTKQIQKISAKGETKTETVISYGTYQGKRWNGGIQLTVYIDRTEKLLDGNKGTQKVGGTLSIFVNANGDIQDTKIQIPGLDTNKSNTQQVLRFFESLLEKAFPKLPNEGVVVGDSLYNLNFEEKYGKFKWGITAGESIRGRSHFGGRQILVTELTGSIQLEFTERKIEFPVRGYSLVDIDTGIHLFSDSTTAGSFSHKGKDIIWEMKNIASVSLPPKSERLPLGTSSSIQERLKRVKRLLDEGLITTDEAAEKRKEILNSL